MEIQQVAVNLIRNAIEALTAANPKEHRKIKIRTERDNGHAIVRVIDNGPGIDSKTLDRLTDPFFSTKPNGMGMGLAISRTIINSHDGKLTFKYANGDGACVSFEVPSINLPAGT